MSRTTTFEGPGSVDSAEEAERLYDDPEEFSELKDACEAVGGTWESGHREENFVGGEYASSVCHISTSRGDISIASPSQFETQDVSFHGNLQTTQDGSRVTEEFDWTVYTLDDKRWLSMPNDTPQQTWFRVD